MSFESSTNFGGSRFAVSPSGETLATATYEDVSVSVFDDSGKQLWCRNGLDGGFKMTIETLLSGLSITEKLDAKDILWRDLSKNAVSYVSPDWHVRDLASVANLPMHPTATLVFEQKLYE